MPTIDDTQANQLKSVTDGMAPVMDKLSDGNSDLNSADITRMRQAYDAWRSTADTF